MSACGTKAGFRGLYLIPLRLMSISFFGLIEDHETASKASK